MKLKMNDYEDKGSRNRQDDNEGGIEQKVNGYTSFDLPIRV